MNILEKLWFRAKTGYPIEVFNGGRPVKAEHQLHFKNIYIHILEGDDDYSIGWQTTPVDHLPVRDIIEVKL